MRFGIGDIVKDKRSCARYIVTGISSSPSGRYWRGIAKNGVTQGGTVFGCDDFDGYKVIGHFDLEPMYAAIEKAWHDDFRKTYGKECTWC